MAPLATPLVAQERQDPETTATGAGTMGRIVAILVDGTTGRPIPEALVTLEELSRRTLSDSAGAAIFLDVPPGTYTLGIRHIAYGEQSASVDVEGMTSAIIGIELDPRAIAVAPLEVVVEQRPRYLEERGFYDRRAVGLGTFFDPMFVDRWAVGGWGNRADRFIQQLIEMSPQMESLVGAPASDGKGGIASIGDGFSGGCPAVYVDGRRTFNDSGKLGGRPSSALEMMSTYTIGAVEIYPSSHGVPDFALEPEMGCGSIVIWTNRWRGRARELGGGEIELCRPADPALTQVEGVIRDEYTGVTLPGAHVFAVSYARETPGETREEEIVADRNGRYRVCDLPEGQRLTLRVEAADRRGPELQIPLENAASPLVTRDLTLRIAGPGRVVGRVLDRATGRPVAAASIGVVGAARRTQTDELGYFSLPEVLPGDHVLEIEHLGFEPIDQLVSIVADRTVDVNVQLSADPIALEPLVVTALRDRRLEIRGFYERRTWAERTGLGEMLDEEAISRRSPARVSNILREMPGLEIACSGSRQCQIRSRGAGCDQVNVYVNGQLTLGEGRRDPLSIDELVRPSEIAGLEVYTGAGQVPAEFSGVSGRCGAIVIWTK